MCTAHTLLWCEGKTRQINVDRMGRMAVPRNREGINSPCSSLLLSLQLVFSLGSFGGWLAGWYYSDQMGVCKRIPTVDGCSHALGGDTRCGGLLVGWWWAVGTFGERKLWG